MTNKEALAIAITACATNEEVAAKLSSMVESLSRKSASRSSKPTKAQVENEGIKAQILEVLQSGEGMTCTQIATAVGIHPNKASALLTQLGNWETKTHIVGTGMVKRYAGEKRTTLFALA